MAFAGWVFLLPIRYLQDGMSSESAFLASSTEIGTILLSVCLMVCSIAPGLMMGNILAWLVVPLRNIYSREAHANPGTDFKSAIRKLSSASVAILVVVYPLALTGGLNYFSVDSEGIKYRRLFVLNSTEYQWTQVQIIETKCWSKGIAGHASFRVSFRDGVNIDLFDAGPKNFFRAYPMLSMLLKDVPFEFRYERKYFGEQQASYCPKAWVDYFVHRPQAR